MVQKYDNPDSQNNSNTKGGQIRWSDKGDQNEVIRKDKKSDTQNYNNNKGGQIRWSDKGGQKQGDDTRTKIVEAMRKNPEISRRDLSKLLNISPSAIQKHIAYLKEANIIVRLGSDRKGLWKVLK